LREGSGRRRRRGDLARCNEEGRRRPQSWQNKEEGRERPGGSTEAGRSGALRGLAAPVGKRRAQAGQRRTVGGGGRSGEAAAEARGRFLFFRWGLVGDADAWIGLLGRALDGGRHHAAGRLIGRSGEEGCG